MLLREYFAFAGRGSAARLARSLKVSKVTVHRWALPFDHPRHIFPEIHHAKALKRETDRNVDYIDIYGEKKLREIKL